MIPTFSIPVLPILILIQLILISVNLFEVEISSPPFPWDASREILVLQQGKIRDGEEERER